METVTHVAGRLKQDLRGCHNQSELSGEFYRKVRCVDTGGIRKMELLGSTVRMMNCNVGLIKE